MAATSRRGCRRSMTTAVLVVLLAVVPCPAARAQLGDAKKCRDTCLEGCAGWAVVCHVSCASACAGAGGIGIMSIDNGVPPDHPNHDHLPKPPLHHHPLRGAGGIAASPAPSPASSS